MVLTYLFWNYISEADTDFWGEGSEGRNRCGTGLGAQLEEAVEAKLRRKLYALPLRKRCAIWGVGPGLECYPVS